MPECAVISTTASAAATASRVRRRRVPAPRAFKPPWVVGWRQPRRSSARNQRRPRRRGSTQNRDSDTAFRLQNAAAVQARGCLHSRSASTRNSSGKCSSTPQSVLQLTTPSSPSACGSDPDRGMARYQRADWRIRSFRACGTSRAAGSDVRPPLWVTQRRRTGTGRPRGNARARRRGSSPGAAFDIDR